VQTQKFTKSLRKEDVVKDWLIVDAAEQTVGRLASQVAALIRGKHKPWFTPHVDCGDFVIVINADKIKMTGKRVEQKEYFSHSGYPGSAKFTTFKDMMQKKPERVIELAVKGMLPKNRLGRSMHTNLKIYSGNEHPHAAQQPKQFKLDN